MGWFSKTEEEKQKIRELENARRNMDLKILYNQLVTEFRPTKGKLCLDEKGNLFQYLGASHNEEKCLIKLY